MGQTRASRKPSVGGDRETWHKTTPKKSSASGTGFFAESTKTARPNGLCCARCTAAVRWSGLATKAVALCYVDRAPVGETGSGLQKALLECVARGGWAVMVGRADGRSSFSFLHLSGVRSIGVVVAVCVRIGRKSSWQVHTADSQQHRRGGVCLRVLAR